MFTHNHPTCKNKTALNVDQNFNISQSNKGRGGYRNHVFHSGPPHGKYLTFEIIT